MKHWPKLDASLLGEISATASVSGTIDFTLAWNTNSVLPAEDSMTLSLNEVSADVAVDVDDIHLDAQLAMLYGSIIDSGPGGNFDSLIDIDAEIDAGLVSGDPINIGSLPTLTTGDINVDVVLALSGVLYYETNLAGITLPGYQDGDFGLQLDLVKDLPKITPIGDLPNVLDQIKSLSPRQIADIAFQFADWLTGLGNFGSFKDQLPIGGGSFGKWADLGSELKRLLFDDFQQLELDAETAPQSTTAYSDATKFQLTVSDSVTVDVELDPTATGDNSTINDLAADLSAAIAKALDGTDYPASIIATVVDGKLALRSTLPGITGIRLSQVEEQTEPGVARLGFIDGQAVDQLRMETLQDLEQIIQEALGTAASLIYDRTSGTISIDLSLNAESLLGQSQLDIGSDIGGLFDIRTNSTIELWGQASADFTLGFFLDDLGSTFQLTENTPLDSLESWGMGIEDGISSTLSPTAAVSFAKEIRFDLEIDGNAYPVAIPQSETQGNGSLLDLSTDLNDAVGSALAGTGLDTELTFVVVNDTLKLTLPGNAIASVRLQESNTSGEFYGLRRLGFTAGDAYGHHLSITPRIGSVFMVDLEGVTTIGDVIDRIEAASPDLSVDLTEDGRGLKVTDSSYDPAVDNEDDLNDRFTISAANGSFAGVILGLVEEDDGDDGIIEGRPLGGASFSERFFVEDFTATLEVNAVAEDIDALASFGIVEVGVENGNGEANASLELVLNDPDSDGRIFLSEIVENPVLGLIGTPTLECDLNLELPLVLSSSIAGLSLPGDAAIIVSWADIHNGTEPSVYLRGLDSLKGFHNLSGFGLSRDLDIERAIEGALSVVADLADVRIQLDGTNFDIRLAVIDPSIVGVDPEPVLTFGNLADAIRLQTDGKVTLNFSADGRGLVLNDNTGSSTFTVTGLNGSGVLGQLGLSGIGSVGGVIEGDAIYQPNLLDGLRRIVDLLKSFRDLPAMSQPIPGTRVSIGDMLDFADKLDAAIDRLQTKPQATLQELEQLLEEELSIPDTALALQFDSNAIGGDAIKIVFNLSDSDSEDVGFNFTLDETLGNLVDISGQAGLNATAAYDFTLALGIDLADPEDLRPFLYTTPNIAGALGDRGTSLRVTVSASAPDINMSAAIGPLGARIVNGYACIDEDGAGAGSNPAAFTATVEDPDGDGRRYLDDLTADSLDYTFVGGADVQLPVEVSGSSVGTIGFTVPDLLDPTNFSVSVPDFSSVLSSFNPAEDLGAFLDGWDGLLGLLEDKLIDKLDAIELPIIGNQLGDLAQFIIDLRSGVSGIGAAGLVGPAAISYLQSELFTVFTGLSSTNEPGALGVLIEKDGSAGVTVDDVVVNQGTNFVEFAVSLGGSIPVGQIDDLGFDLNLPGLGLELTEDPVVGLVVNWQIDVGVGIDKNDGVYLLLDPSKTDDLHIDFIADVTGGNLGAQLGFLELAVVNNRTEVAAEFDVDLDPGSDGRITLSEIFSTPLTTFFTGNVLEGGVDNNKAAIIDWQLTASINGNAALPQMRTGFNLDWTVNTFGDLATAPTIEFSDVEMNLGSFLSDFLGPIVDKVNDTLEPIRPVLDVLTEPIPVISDLGGPVTLLDLADFFGYGDYNDFIYAVDDIADLAQQLSGISGDNWINLGGFTVDGALAGSARGRDNLTAAVNAVETFETIRSQIDASPQPAQAAAFNSSVGFSGGGGFKFPILENPSSAFGLLLGHDVTLFGYDMPALVAQFEYSQFFPVWGPIGARITGSVRAELDFAFGFDTFGMRQFAENAYQFPEQILNGFFVSDTASVDGTGADVPEITLSGALKAAAEVNVVVARIGVGGGIGVDVYFDLHDNNNDGKVRVDEIIDNFNLGPIHVFDVSGQATANLFAYYEIGFRAFGKWVKIAGDEYELAEVVLLDFSLPRPESTPNDISYVEGGVLMFNTTNAADQVVVRPGSVPGEVFVSVNGRDEPTGGNPHTGVTSILFEGQGGNDRFTVQSGISVPVTARGGDGNDVLVLGDNTAEVEGGEGNDIITLGSGAAIVRGDEGDDDITGSDGNDTIYAGPGRDLIKARGGNDRIFGDSGANRIEGGRGDDEIDGGTDGDFIDGGRDNDIIRGNGGDDEIVGGFGDDILIGGGGADRLEGDRGNDLLIGDSISVTPVYGTEISEANLSGAGNDVLLGGLGSDYIFGVGGNDRVEAGSGNDFVWTHGGADDISLGTGLDWADGGIGDDIIRGDEGSDTLIGNLGADTIYAGTHASGGGSVSDTNTILGDLETSGLGDFDESNADTIYGDVGADEITASGGSDKVYALGGDNVVDLGEGHNTFTSGSDDDTVTAYSGNDTITISGGNNTINGGDGDNTIFTGSGYDNISTGTGKDVINAGSGGSAANPQIVHAGGGNNRVTTGVGVEQITTLSGNDTIISGDGQKNDRRWRRG